MSYINIIVSFSILVTFYACGMKEPCPKYSNQNAQETNKKGLLIKYRFGLLNYRLPNNAQPVFETQMYALAHPEDQYSQEMNSFITNYLNNFAQVAYSLRKPNANTSDISVEFAEAFKKLGEDKESLVKLLQMHNHAKEQLAKQSPRKK
jgi:hypothetical protein